MLIKNFGDFVFVFLSFWLRDFHFHFACLALFSKKQPTTKLPKWDEKLTWLNKISNLGIFKSNNPEKRADAMAQAITHYNDPKVLASISEDLGSPMVRINCDQMKVKFEHQ